MERRTHERISSALCGRPEALAPGRARVVLETTPETAADAHGFVHGGFTFALGLTLPPWMPVRAEAAFDKSRSRPSPG